MGVLAKKKIYPSPNEEAPSQPVDSPNDRRPAVGQRPGGRLNSQLNHQLNRTHPLKQPDSPAAESQRFNSAKRNRTFIIRKAFQSGLNQLSSTIKRPVNHGRLTKLDSNNVELIQNKYRTNGWSPPIHPLQVAAAFVFLLLTGLLFVYLLPMISLEDERLIYLIYAACILITVVHLILHIVAISINPADDNVIAKQRNRPNKPPPAFDRTQHKHVIENQFCYICECPVSSSRSKHCSRCNVCIDGFDHHCNWLNTCIGSKNYKLFISSVISALLGSGIVFGLSVLFIVCWANSSCAWLDNPYLNGLDYGDADDVPFDNQTSTTETIASSLLTTQLANLTTPLSLTSDLAANLSGLLTTVNSTIDADYGNFTDSPSSTTTDEDVEPLDAGNSLQYQTIIHLCVIFMSLILSTITVVLLLHLLCFHLFLNCIGLSTYEFIVQRREAAQRNLNQEDTADRPTCNERILRCLSCQSDFLLPKSQTAELAAGQSIEKHANHANHASLAKKRQLSQQMSNESRMSRNSKESCHYSSRTVSLYEDFALDKESAVTNKISLAENDTNAQVYLGSPQKQQKRAFEEWKTLNNRSLAAEQKDAGYFESHLKQLNETQANDRLHTISGRNDGESFTSTNRPDKPDNGRLAELNTDNLLNTNHLLNTNNVLINEPVNLDKKARHSPGGESLADDRSERNDKNDSFGGVDRNQDNLTVTRDLSANVSRSESFAVDGRSDQSRNDQSRNEQSRNESRNEQSEFRSEPAKSEQFEAGQSDRLKSGVQFKDDDFLNDKPISQVDSQTVSKYLDNLDEFINQQLNSRNRGHPPTDQIVNTKTENKNPML